jgi:chromosome segregation ATPase
MSEDLTQKLPRNRKDNEILTAIKDLDTHVTKIDNRLQSLEQKFDGLEKKVDGVEKKVDGLEKKVDGVERKVDGLEKKADGLEKKVDERLHDTRPIWHRVVADIAQLQAGQQRLEEGQLAMRNDLGNVSRDQIVINDSIRKIQLDYHAIDDRLYRLEVNRKQPNSST